MAKKQSKTENIIGNLDAKYWVQKSDPLVLMRSVPFSLGELKILDTYISRINASDDSRCTVMFTKEEYEELMGLTCANYRALEKHTKGMLGKVVELEMPNEEYLQFVLFEQARYRKDEYGKPIIELTCTQTAKDLFFCIGKYHYFKYALENVIKLTRKSSYLLYIYIRHNRYRGEWDIPIDELRDIVFDCKEQESYHEYKIFKNRVLEPAVKEVNDKTDCHFKYESIKRGRTVIKIKFIYISESQLDGQMSFDDLPNIPLLTEPSADEEETMLRTYGSERLMLLAEGCGYEFDKEQMEQIERILIRIHIPKDAATNDLTFGRQFYLKEKYAALNTAAAKKAKNSEKPIKDRFRYFLKMLEDDAFQPAAYKGE
jgi:hypothetical protein